MEAEVDGCCCSVAGDGTTPAEWKQMNRLLLPKFLMLEICTSPLAVTVMLEILDGSV